MKNNSTPKEEIIECSCGECYKKSYHGVVCPNCAKVNKPVIESTPSEGWAEEIRKHFKIATIAASSVVNAQEGTATKAMLLESYENDLNRHIRYIERLLAKARQEITDWSLKQQEKAYRIGIDIGKQEERQECIEKIKEALEVEKCCYTMHCGCLMENSGLRKNFDDLIKKLEEE